MGSIPESGRPVGDVLAQYEKIAQDSMASIPNKVSVSTPENLQNEIIRVSQLRNTLVETLNSLKLQGQTFTELAESRNFSDLVTQLELLDVSLRHTVLTHLSALKTLAVLKNKKGSTEELELVINQLSENLDKEITANKENLPLKSAIDGLIESHNLKGTFLNALQTKMEGAFTTTVEIETCEEMKHLIAKIKEFTYSAGIDESESQKTNIATSHPNLANFAKLLKLVSTMAQTGKVNYFEVMKAKETLNEIKNTDSVIPASKGNFDDSVAKLEKLLEELEKSCSSPPTH